MKTRPFRLNRSATPKGFALMVSLSLMILLVVIAVGLLSLSSISLRAASTSSAMGEARQNARMAMMLAIGQLQSLTGQDTRVTATADLINTQYPKVTGAWRSWEGTDREGDGKPKAPDYSLKKSAGDPTVPLANAGDGRFLGWLTSSAAFEVPKVDAVPGVFKESANGRVPIVSDGSAKDPAGEVHMAPTFLDGKKGAYAWWTSGENSKAMVNADRDTAPASVVEWHERVKSNPRADAKTFDLETVNTLDPTKQLPSTASLKIVNKAAELKRVHDLTAFSRGLLTNTAAGGWRRDLSLFSERYGSLPSRNLPLFTRAPGEVQTYSKAPQSGNAPNPLIYPWATYRENATGSSWQQVPPICSWDALVEFVTQYQEITSTSASRTSMPVSTISSPKGGTGGNRYKFVDQVRRFPQIARIQWIYSLGSYKDPNPPDKAKPYKAGLLITPVLTMWNPYNVELSYNQFRINIQETSPLRFRFKVGDKTLQDSSLTEIMLAPETTSSGGYEKITLSVPSGVLKPGESRIFGINDPKPRIDTRSAGGTGSGVTMSLSQGYRPNGGYMFFGIDKRQFAYAAADEPFAIDEVMYDGYTKEGGRDGIYKAGIGIIFDLIADGEGFSHRMVYNVPELGGDAVATALYPPLTKKLSVSNISDVEDIKNQPFATAIFAYRMASPMSNDLARHKHLFTKGMLQANPLCFYTEIGFGDDNEAITSMAGTGVYHPVNAPYDFAFNDVNGWNDNLAIPEFERSTYRSYIVSGMSSADGLTRCVMAELPTRPLQSLAELQHFDARYNNPIPPFQFNLIGNGSANPIFAPDQVSVSTRFNDGMCNDDTYILNHLFFDDWFVSSIAPEIRDFRDERSPKRDLRRVYREHLETTTPLVNRCYVPAADAAVVDGKVDVDKAVSNAYSTSKDSKTGMYSFESIASKLEVEGMFNVNSVSLDAWKALLRQGRDMEVPYVAANGRTQSATSSGFPYPRTTIAGDMGSDSGSSESGATNPNAAEFAGYRVLTDEQIDALAEQIVSEIRQRGPFLSLAEFVNRQLTTDKNLAIASAVQKALDNLAGLGSSSKNPFKVLQDNSVQITGLPPGTTHDYKFPEAAFGWSAYGVPGWIRQADILRPIAPILSARDDTFTIRAYGDSRDRANPDRILAQAWCEVVVKRNPEYVDPADPAAVHPHSSKMTSASNKRYGRRYDIVSFRWLDPSEI